MRIEQQKDHALRIAAARIASRLSIRPMVSSSLGCTATGMESVVMVSVAGGFITGGYSVLTRSEKDKLLMIPGPTPVKWEILEALGEPTISHTGDGISAIMIRAL